MHIINNIIFKKSKLVAITLLPLEKNE